MRAGHLGSSAALLPPAAQEVAQRSAQALGQIAEQVIMAAAAARPTQQLGFPAQAGQQQQPQQSFGVAGPGFGPCQLNAPALGQGLFSF
eukprot:12582271-Alexandrium_andersonii.AAC.1